jgi:hypothetical protein
VTLFEARYVMQHPSWYKAEAVERARQYLSVAGELPPADSNPAARHNAA